MINNDRQNAQLASTLVWLEDNVRENKAQMARVQQQVEQVQTQVWDLTHRLHRSEEIAVALGTQLGVIPRLENEITGLNDKAVRIDDRQVTFEMRLSEVTRQQHVDADHVRASLNELVKRVDGWERLTQNWSSRFDGLEEVTRRAHESAGAVRQRVEEFERFVELVDQRGGRTADALKRVDTEFARLHGEIEALQKQDVLAVERLQVYAEIVKRFDDELAVVAQQTDVRREFNERFELHRTGLRRGEERLASLEAVDEEMQSRLEDHQRELALLEAKDKSFRERVVALQEELAQYRAHVADQFGKVQVLAERQRRRQIEYLEREIRELKVNAYRPSEE